MRSALSLVFRRLVFACLAFLVTDGMYARPVLSSQSGTVDSAKPAISRVRNDNSFWITFIEIREPAAYLMIATTMIAFSVMGHILRRRRVARVRDDGLENVSPSDPRSGQSAKSMLQAASRSKTLPTS
jgi:hypothetical protein